jgi:hypothetical protein
VAEDHRTVREAEEQDALAAQERRQRWETEYRRAVEACYLRGFRELQALRDDLEAEFQQEHGDALTSAAKQGQQLRDKWHADEESRA